MSWGFFNANFEQKEYMEAYVAEEVAREMLAQDPKLKAEFEARLKADAAFAASPSQRLDFFAQRHPSHDDRFNLYPMVRTSVAPAGSIQIPSLPDYGDYRENPDTRCWYFFLTLCGVGWR